MVIGSRELAGHLFEDDEQARFHYGRLKKVTLRADTAKGKTRKVKTSLIYTLPLYGWTDPDPAVKGDNGGGYVTLIDELLDHMHTAADGRNRYNIAANMNTDTIFINTMKKFRKFMKALEACPTPSIDTESRNLNKLVNQLLCLQFTLPRSTNPEDGYVNYFLPFEHFETPWGKKEYKEIKEALRHYFETASPEYTIFQNAKFDISMLYSQLGVRWFNPNVFDVSAGEFCLNENRKFLRPLLNGKVYSLDALERKYGFFRKGLSIDKEDRSNMASQRLKDIVKYGITDTVTPYLIHLCQLAEAKRKKYKGFKKVVVNQIGVTSLVMSIMETGGIGIDIERLKELMLPGSDLHTLMKDTQDKIRGSKHAQKLNDILLKERGYNNSSQMGLFGRVEKPWLVELNLPEHKERLFFEVMGLEPINLNQKGKGRTDNDFQTTYKTVPEVALLTRFNKLMKIKTAFVDAMYLQLQNDPDFRTDFRLRAQYDYRYIVSGRSSSRNPNLQAMPSRGPLAKIVKSLFKAMAGRILIKSDFSAHEVRGLGNIAFDKIIIETFKVANESIRRLRLAKEGPELEEALKRWKVESDIHIQNVLRFFGIQVDKDHPLRSDIKTVVFGVAYGMAAPSLAGNLRKGNIDRYRALKDEVKKIKATIKELRRAKKKSDRHSKKG